MSVNQVPDSIKVAGATSPTVMTFIGIPVEQWMYVASAIVSVMFIIEKMPIVIKRIKSLIVYVKSKKP